MTVPRVAAGVPACRLLRLVLTGFLLAVCVFASPPATHAAPITFSFELAPGSAEPFAREITATVQTPGGRVLRIPAFFAGGNTFSVRARADERGTYRITALSEQNGNRIVPLHPSGDFVAAVEHRGATARASVRRDPVRRSQFRLSSGEPYVPIGANLSWPSRGTPLAYYRRGIPAFGDVGLNWMRIWMAHWGGLNLDWLPPRMGPSPAPGSIDLRVAADWDALLDLAEKSGVYIQLVLQHHGQYSTTVNPNWAENPWNAALPGGFLEKPADFFTSERARALTKRKYRYIVARYGWSSAIMAWEFFNEFHWVDAIHSEKNFAVVARWHREMADYLRRIDPYQHLVVTSTDDLRSPSYEPMDFFQPHLYPSNILTAIRTYHVPIATLDRPIFYGEYGDDHQPLTAAEKKSNNAIVPPVWASLMGVGELPAQVWLGWNLLDNGRIGELGAVARFLSATRIAERPGLTPFSPVVESRRHRVPLTVTPAHVWQRRPPSEVVVPLDGTQPLDFADIPRHLSGIQRGDGNDIPAKTTFRIHFPAPAKLIARFANGSDRGASVHVLVDGTRVAEHTWPVRTPAKDAAKRPAEVAFDVPAGERTITLENPGGGDVEFHELYLGRDTATLAAIGKRSDDFIAVWLWHRTQIFAVRDPKRITGTVILDDVPEGSWRVTWWDTKTGHSISTRTLTHRGGKLELNTPRISRHAAVTLDRP